ncbi:type I 3-dehydroquinate dehydratase [Candidatus Gracilibacteria bacterium]|nr:type I 3-dehydroquinate dehydratase [Candidatus Gracilibacteria bacterium]
MQKNRQQIDKIDAQIISLLAQRKEQILAIKKYKMTHKITVKDPKREEQLLELWRKNAEKHGLTIGELYPIYDQILHWSRYFQKSRPVRIAIPIVAPTLKEALAQIHQAEKEGADLIELRFDYFINPTTQDLKKLLSTTKLPKILTIRTPDQGGHFHGSETLRQELFEFAIKSHIEFIDIEFTSKFRPKSLNKTKLILSDHNFTETPNNLEKLYKKIATQKPDLIKIVTTAQTPTDNQKIYELLQIAQPDTLIALAMGEHGKSTRISTPSLGAYLTFAALNTKSKSAPGQLTIKQLRQSLQNIALIGGRGVGKSHYARELAAKTGQPLISTDNLIEQLAGASIPQIVKKYGWQFFRELEYQALQQAMLLQGAILDCGGGIVCEQDHDGHQTFSQRKAALLKQAKVIHIQAPLKTQLARLTKDKTRPALTEIKSLEHELKATMKLRSPWYQKVAN